jgi:hypothetical protein
MVLRKIYGPKKDEECRLLSTVRIMIYRTEHMARMDETRNAYRIWWKSYWNTTTWKTKETGE